MSDVLFEICCGSAEDAIQSWRGGAKRVELNSDLFHGGLTPSIGSLKQVKKEAPDLEVLCMVRPREGGFNYTEIEFETMIEDAKAFIENGADGIVFGFLNPDGTVDVERVRKFMSVIDSKTTVFHRAVDVVPDVFKALDILIDMGIDRVLTSGQKPTVPEGAQTIKEMIEHAKGRIKILPGGGVTPQNANWCKEFMGVDELHLAIHKTHFDTSALGNPSIYFGGAVYPREDCFQIVDSQDINRLITDVNSK